MSYFVLNYTLYTVYVAFENSGGLNQGTQVHVEYCNQTASLHHDDFRGHVKASRFILQRCIEIHLSVLHMI